MVALPVVAPPRQGLLAVWLPVPMGIGVLAYFALRHEPPLWSGPLVIAFGLALSRRLRWPGVAILMIGLGFACGSLATWRAPPPLVLPRKATIVSGVVRGVEPQENGRRLTIVAPRLDGGPALPRSLHVRLRATDLTPVATGQTVSLRALLRPPPPPAYPGAWDLQRDDFFAGLGGGGFALGKVSPGSGPAGDGLGGWWQGVRDGVAARALAALPAREGGIAATLLAGEPAAIPAEQRAAFRDAGLAHLLAIAGLHIGIVMALVFGLTRSVLARFEHAALHWPVREIAALAALSAGGLYLALTGAHLPILRSFAMACLVTAGLLAGRRAVSLQGWALAALALLALWPNALNGAAFQMSFAAVLALIAGYEALRPWLTRLRGDGRLWHRARSHLAALALTSLLAGAASAPFGAYHFGRVQLYFVVSNLLAVPITAVWVMPLGLAALLLMPLHLASFALVPMGWGIALLTMIAGRVAAWPAASLAVPPPPGWGLALIALGLLWLCLGHGRPRLGGLALLLAGTLSPMLAQPPDLLVSSDARLIALRRPAGLLVQRGSGTDAFTLDAWRQLWAVNAIRPFPDVGDGGVPGLACSPTGCRIGPLLLARDVTVTSPDCAGVRLVIAAEPARDLCPDAAVVDRFSVWRDGATAVWLHGDRVLTLSDRTERGDRPWVPPPPIAAPRAVSTLPRASAE